MLQPSKLRAYGQNCPTIEVFPAPLIVRNQELPWNLGKLTLGQMIIKLGPKYQAAVYVYCGNDNYQQPIYVKLGDNLATEKPNAVIPPNKNVKAMVIDPKLNQPVKAADKEESSKEKEENKTKDDSQKEEHQESEDKSDSHELGKK